MAPRVPIPLREIVYSLSPYRQEVFMQGVYKLPGKIAHKLHQVRVFSLFLALVLLLPSLSGVVLRGCIADLLGRSLLPTPHLQHGSGYAIFSTVLFAPIL